MSAATFVFDLGDKPDRVAEGGKTLRLQAPSFAGIANAETDSAGLDIGALLEQEAGISAYYQSPYAITLSQVRPLFRVIEAETADYIIGSVPVAGYTENADAHVYVHKDGWILAYFLIFRA